MILLSTTIKPVWAGSRTLGFNVWPMVTTDNKDKVWSVKFNMPLDPKTIDNNSIYILDENETVVSSTVSATSDGTVIKITPIRSYLPGKKYQILITKLLTNPNGIKLNSEVVVPFVVIDNSIAINFIDDQWSTFVTNITVVTKAEVSIVKVNNQEMHYEGNNVYSLGILNQKPGNSITVKAYDNSNKILDTQKYTIH